MFRHVLNHPAVTLKFASNDITTLDNWFDMVSHFKPKSAIHYFTSELPSDPTSNLQQSNVHFWPSKHGKSLVDGHFGMVFVAIDTKAANCEHVI